MFAPHVLVLIKLIPVIIRSNNGRVLTKLPLFVLTMTEQNLTDLDTRLDVELLTIPEFCGFSQTIV